MVEKFSKAAKVTSEAREQLLRLVLNQLQLYITFCRLRGPYASSRRRDEFESRARERLGRAVAVVSRLDLTPEQNERFLATFRELADCLPIAFVAANVVPIDSLKKRA